MRKALILLALLPLTAASEARFATGKWEVTSQIIDAETGSVVADTTLSSKMKEPAEINRLCVGPDRVEDGVFSFPEGHACRVAERSYQDGKMRLVAQCLDEEMGGSMIMLGDYTATSVNGIMDMNVTSNRLVENEGPISVKMKVSVSAKRIGECEQNAEASVKE